MSGLGYCVTCGRPRQRLPWRTTPQGSEEALNDRRAWGWMLICPEHLTGWSLDLVSDPPPQRLIDETVDRYYLNDLPGEPLLG